jgi:hypothetical protein
LVLDAFAYIQQGKEIPMDRASLTSRIPRYKSDPESVYNTWFVDGEERMKAFRAIRRGVRDTVDSITGGTFGNDFKGSPLEVVLSAITEQKQVFEGVAHPFFWKPKLRILDIYKNENDKKEQASEPVLLIAVEWVFDLTRHEIVGMFCKYAEACLCAKIDWFAAIDCTGITMYVFEFPTAGGLRKFGYVI